MLWKLRDFKKLWVAILFLCLLLVSGKVVEGVTYQKELHAQSDTVTEDIAITYFEWANILSANGGEGYAVAENGDLYYSSNIKTLPFRRVYTGSGDSLKNIKKVATQNYLNRGNSCNIFVFALTTDGKVFVKGSNEANVFANSAISYTPTFIPLPYEFNAPAKDVKVGANNAYVLLENGELYASGSNVGLGLGTTERSEGFSKVTVDRVKQIEVNNNNVFALDEDGVVWTWGEVPFGRTDGVWSSNTPIRLMNDDGTNFNVPVTFLGNASISMEIMGNADGIGLVFVGEDKKLYYMQNRGTNGINVGEISFTPKPVVAQYPELTGNVTRLTFGMHNISLVDNNTFYVMYTAQLIREGNYDRSSNATDAVNKIIAYQSESAGVDASTPILNAGATYAHSYLIKAENNRLYLNGIPAKFVLDLDIEAKKDADNSSYGSGEKYNDDIRFSFDVAEASRNSIRYKIAELPETTYGEEQAVENYDNFPIQVAQGEHIHRTYRAYIAGKEQEYSTTFTVDLYKQDFSDVSVSDGGAIALNSAITWDETNGLEGNHVVATLTNEDGDSVNIASGDTINVEGSYHLMLKDDYGNQYDADFHTAPSPQGITFRPLGDLVFGNQYTIQSARMGKLSLVYGEGLPQLLIVEADITDGNEQGYFSLEIDSSSNSTFLKAASNVPAGEYTLSISGKDGQGIEFEDLSFTFEVTPATATLVWSEDTLSAEQDGLYFSDAFQAQVANAPEGIEITYELVENVTGVNVAADGTFTYSNITQDSVTVSVKALPQESGNYVIEPITIELTIRKKDLALKTTIQDDTTYVDTYEITLGDALPNFQVEQTDTILTTVPQPTSYQIFTSDNEQVEVITEAGVYTIQPVYQNVPTELNLYDVTWTYAQLHVAELIVDDTNASQFYTLTLDDENNSTYTEGTWTNKEIIITPTHSVFSRMRVNGGEQASTAYHYHENGEEEVVLNFCTIDNACVETTVNVNYDDVSPVVDNFAYREVNTSPVSNFLRMITFDRYFRNAQEVTFTGTDSHSGISEYRYRLVKLDGDGNELADTLVEDTITASQSITLDINTSYRISAWAIDHAGNESRTEKIERVYLNDQIAELEITATSNGIPYDGTAWTDQSIHIDVSSSSELEVEYYEYSSDGINFTRITGNQIELPNPLTDVDATTYYFRGHHVDGSICEDTLLINVDTVKPVLSVQATSNGEEYQEGTLVHHNIQLQLSQEQENISGITYYYTTDQAISTSTPSTENGWIEIDQRLEHTTNGENTYYFKAVSGANKVSDLISFDVALEKLEYTAVEVTTTSEEENYQQGDWAKGDITFQLSGGIVDETLITGYEYTITNGNEQPTLQAQWQPVNQQHAHRIEETTIDRTYWFRPLPWDQEGRISQGIHVNLDVEAPTIPTISVSDVNTNLFARLLNQLSQGNWFSHEVQVVFESEDLQSGMDHYEIEELIGEEPSFRDSNEGILRYDNDIEVILRAKACDRAGNCSDISGSEEIRIDLHAPIISGAEHDRTYVHYQQARTISVQELVSGIAESTLQKENGPTIDIDQQIDITEAGTYTVYAKDHAGNEISITFVIEELPSFDTIDGSDESYQIIEEMIQEARAADQEQLNQSEYREWIEDATQHWQQQRVPSITTSDQNGKIDSLQDTGFDPTIDLIVERIEEDEIPSLPRNALYVYDVYLKKGNTVVQSNGDVKVYLPYSESEVPIVYQIDRQTNEITQIPAQKEGDFVTFTVSNLMKYAISNTAQPINRLEVCAIGPDTNLNTDDDVCGVANEQGQEAIRNEDGSIDVAENGSIRFPNNIEIQAPQGAHIYPDGNVLLADGTEYNPDGTIKRVDNDSNKDRTPDVNVDVDCDGIADINIDTDNDHLPDINIDTTGDGIPNYNVDIRNSNQERIPDGIPDLNIGPIDWNTDICKTTECGKRFCTSSYYHPYLNIDTDNDQLPDVNIDLDQDNEADLNIDTDFDFVPNINIDTTGDGKPDINIDVDGDGTADENLLDIDEWKPTKNAKQGIAYDTMPNLKPDPNLNADNTSKNPDDSSSNNGSNTSSSNDKDTNDKDTSVKGNYHIGGANTGIKSNTIYFVCLCLSLLTFMSLCIYHYKKQ